MRPLALVIKDDDQVAELVAWQLRTEGSAVMRAATDEVALVFQPRSLARGIAPRDRGALQMLKEKQMNKARRS